jgi:hypothetical protein
MGAHHDNTGPCGTRGLVLGKFAPLHKGHQLLIETTLPLSLRAGWIRQIYPQVRVIEAEDGPTEVGDDDQGKGTMTMGQLFSVEAVFFTVLGYPMSYIEFFGTILYLWSVWLMARGGILTWPVGIVSVLLYVILLGMAVSGLFMWVNKERTTTTTQ